MPEKSSAEPDTAGREIVTIRVFDAPPARVFEAWGQSENLEKWWGPQGFTTTTHAFDFRPGGAWKHTMHGPDGVDYPHRVVYTEIVWPERIAYSHYGGIEGVPAQFEQTVTFAARGDKTELTMRMVFPSAAARSAVAEKYHAVEGAKETLARLAEHVGPGGYPPAAGRAQELRMQRVFDAPRRLVFEAWSKAEYVSRWFTPSPMTTPKCEVDFRPGGAFRVVMRMPNGIEFPFEAEFRDIVPMERIVFEGKMHDGNTVSTTVTFAEDDGKTTVTVRQAYAFESDATRGAHAGWTQTLNQLGDHVAAR